VPGAEAVAPRWTWKPRLGGIVTLPPTAVQVSVLLATAQEIFDSPVILNVESMSGVP
jgi:hypothetical protein